MAYREKTPKRVLVTGGAGFVGSTYVRRLLSGMYPSLTGAEVTVLDRLTYAGRECNLEPVRRHPDLEFVQGDVCDAALVRRLLRDTDVLVHFAAESHVDRSIQGAGEFVRTNVLGTQVLMAAASDAGVGRVVHVSTDEVYGSIEQGAWTEESPVSPNSPYAASKAASDLIALAFHRTHGLPVCVTRCSNNYGPHQFPEKLIPRFLSLLMRGEPVPLYGDGANERDWLHVDDHCDGVQLVAESGRPGEIYNIGGGTPLANLDLVRTLLDAVGADFSLVQWVEDRKGHDRRYAVDYSKIGAELGYRPRVSFPEGLAETIRWYRDNLDWLESVPAAPQGTAPCTGGG